jgi:LEA14-like dessication related protein
MAGTLRTLCRLLPFLLFFPLLLSGCAGLGPKMEEPTITVTNLQLQEAKGLETIFLLELRVINPNDFPLDIRGLNCELKIDGRRFATGLSDVQQEVPPFGTAVVPVSVYASMFDMVGSVIEILQNADRHGGAAQPLRYELDGRIRMGGVSTRTVPFHSRGEIDLTGSGQ